MKENHIPSVKTYIIGFAVSLGLSVGAYLATWYHLHTHHQTPSDATLIPLIVFCAIVQLFVQLVCFLHVRGQSGRWNRYALAATVLVVFILVAGTVWIMNNLNYNMMNMPEASPDYIMHDEGFGDKHDTHHH